MTARANDGLRSPPRHAPRALRSTDDLRRLQRLMTHAVIRPLGPADTVPERWTDGRTTAEVAEEFIKPNDRLTSVERLHIYQRMYWYRLIGSAADDCPGLRAILGEDRFDALIRAYLARYPSRSFTLRDLCSRLARFIEEAPRWTVPRTALARAIARFEWAQTVAFDGAAHPPISARSIQRTPPERLRLGLQPYLTLLDVPYAVDDYVRTVRRRAASRADASNTMGGPGRRRRARTVAIPRRRRTWLVVHRMDNQIYYRRIDRAQYLVLAALEAGRPVAAAVAEAGRSVRPEEIGEWFSLWVRLGWICRHTKSARLS
ncbi:MAG: HvfC/BufC family peptide modification chaperone [Opitutaceae bacterium]